MNKAFDIQFKASVVRRELGAEPDKTRLEYLQSIELKEAIRLIHEAEIPFVVFDAKIFGLGKNDHNIRPEPGSGESLAQSFNGQAFLFDHAKSMDSKKGRIEKAWLADDAETIEATFKVVDPAAMEDAVRGKIEEFSAGVRGEAWYCSLCGEDWVSFWFWAEPGCDHIHGEEYSKEDGTMAVAEAYIRRPEGVECSAVWKGAYPGTGIMFSSVVDEDIKAKFMEFMMAEKTKDQAVVNGKEEQLASAAETATRQVESQQAPESLSASSEREQYLQERLFASLFNSAIREGKLSERHRAFFEKWTKEVGIEILDEFTAIGGGEQAKTQTEFVGTAATNNSGAAPEEQPRSLTDRVIARRKANKREEK
jgi:hypothetical protein